MLRSAMSIGEGCAAVFFLRPMAITLVVIVVAVLVLPRVAKAVSAGRERAAWVA